MDKCAKELEYEKELYKIPGGLNMGNPIDLSRSNPERVFSHYRWLVKQLYGHRRKLKNPINSKTGKPLKSSTLKSYASEEKSYGQAVKERKQEIRRMILAGYLGHKTRMRWLSEIAKTFDYAKGLPVYEKRFVEAFAGNPILAARQAGYKGNFITIKKIGLENMKKPGIQNAIKCKRYCKMLNHGMFLLYGGGQGDGKPFKVKLNRTRKKGIVLLESYLIDIRERLTERAKAITGYDHNAGWQLYNAAQGLSIEDDVDKFIRVREKLQAAENKLNIIYRGGLYKGY